MTVDINRPTSIIPTPSFIEGEGVERGKGNLFALDEEIYPKGGGTNKVQWHQDAEGKEKPLH